MQLLFLGKMLPLTGQSPRSTAAGVYRAKGASVSTFLGDAHAQRARIILYVEHSTLLCFTDKVAS